MADLAARIYPKNGRSLAGRMYRPSTVDSPNPIEKHSTHALFIYLPDLKLMMTVYSHGSTALSLSYLHI